MSDSALKDSIYWKIWADVFGFMCRYYPVTADKEYPDRVVKGWESCIAKYKGSPAERFAGDILTDVISELGRLYWEVKAHE